MFLVVLLFLRETHQFSRISKSQREASAPNQGIAKYAQVISVVSVRYFVLLLQDRRRHFLCLHVVFKENTLDFHETIVKIQEKRFPAEPCFLFSRLCLVFVV